MDLNNLHLVMPMCGKGSRFAKKGFEIPKPLIDIQGRPFFYWSTESVRSCIEPMDINFVILKSNIEDFALDKIIHKYYPKARLHVLDETPPGAVLTCLEGIKDLALDEPVIFNDCDHLFRSPAFEEFCRGGLQEEIDGALLTFESDEAKFSYLELDESGYVKSTVEKCVVSSHAICGAYYFSSSKKFKEAAEANLRNCNYSEYYLSGVYNELIKKNGRVVNFPVSLHIPFGTPEEYDIAMEIDFTML